MAKIIPVVLCGGSGTRLWPASRKALPKQFLPLVTERTLFQETLLRLGGTQEFAAPLVICNQEHRFLAAEQMQSISIKPQLHILEPVGRNTAPAIAIAALAAKAAAPDSILLVLPADHLIRDVSKFHAAISTASRLAEQGKVVTFGIKPDTPAATGFGYIERGKSLGEDAAFEVLRFVEKPNLEIARSYTASGNYFWNSGMFVVRADTYLAELQQYRLDILRAAEEAWATRVTDLDFCRLDQKVFSDCPSDSIDYAVMEHTQRAAMVTVDIGWNDVGSWTSLHEVSEKDDNQNVLRGDAYVEKSSGCYIRVESRLVAAIGVCDLIIVETADAVLVTHKDQAQHVKLAVEHLHNAGRDEHLIHRRVFRPWGYYEGIDEGSRFQVKRIMVKPGARLSLQKHQKRAEHWIVVSGQAKVTRGGEVMQLETNQSTYIPLGEIHRLENIGIDPLYMIEVQSGDYVGEDDIERIEDDYFRA